MLKKPRLARREFLTAAAGATAGLTASAADAADLPTALPPAMTLDDLHRTVQSAIPRVGKVVFVRYTIFGPEKTDIVAVLSHLAEAARTWTAQLPDRLYAVGSVTNGQVCVTL